MTNAQIIAALNEVLDDPVFFLYDDDRDILEDRIKSYINLLICRGESAHALVGECIYIYESPVYQEYLQSDKWKAFRNSIIEEREQTCEICGVRIGDTSQLHVHHLHYDTLGHETSNDVALLCSMCHQRVHSVKDMMKGFEKQLPDKYKRIDEAFNSQKDRMHHLCNNACGEIEKERRKVLHELESSEGSIAHAYADAIQSTFNRTYMGKFFDGIRKPRLANIILQTCNQQKHSCLSTELTRLL